MITNLKMQRVNKKINEDYCLKHEQIEKNYLDFGIRMLTEC